MKQKIKNLPLRHKLSIIYLVMTCFILGINLIVYQNVNSMLSRLNHVYEKNVYLSELDESLNTVQTKLTEYLNTKTTDAMEGYYKACQEFSNLLDGLSDEITDDPNERMERNVKNMSKLYMDKTYLAVEAKRGRKIEKYRDYYTEATEYYRYITEYISDLNTQKFKDNMVNYNMLSVSFNYIEMINTFVFVVAALLNIILMWTIIGNMMKPLKKLSETANEVAGGNLDVKPLKIQAQDEVGVVSNTFNQMVISIRQNIEQLKKSMEHERELTEKELKMEAHLKDAKLKYLQAQISPHFLFNTLNAGAQLAMMEEADKTYEYVQNVADFYRYNLKKDSDVATIREELELIDHYIYILNVRFAGEIHYEKQIKDSYLEYQLPSMILQPIVENSVNYGIRGIDWEGKITIRVIRDEEYVRLCIEDNGIGMTQEKIDEIVKCEIIQESVSENSNGIGLINVINRLRLYYGRDDVFEMESEGENKGTKTWINIPVETIEEDGKLCIKS